jgi:Zn-dependent peptidase ImmA (M78 family)
MRNTFRLRSVAAEIYASLGLRIQVPVGSAEVTAPVAEIAAVERQRLGIRVEEQAAWSTDAEAWSAWRAAVEGLGVLVSQFRMPVRELRGFFLSSASEPAAIVVTGKDRVRPRLFTLFHEYAHLILGSAALCIPFPAAVRRRTVEGFCNEFAGELLVPAEALLEQEAAQRLCGLDSFADELLLPLA